MARHPPVGKSTPVADMVTRVASGIWAVPVHSPFLTYVKSTAAYLVRDEVGDAHLVDSGWNGPVSARAIMDALAEVGMSIERLRTITATHVHRDHLGEAEELRGRSGARIILSGADAAEMTTSPPNIETFIGLWGVPASAAEELRAAGSQRSPHPQVSVDIEVADGDVLPIPGRDIRVVSTPGHTPGSICLDDRQDGVLFTGDTVLPKLHPGVGVDGSGDGLENYLRSLHMLAATYPSRLVCPGHGEPFYGIRTRIAQHLAHIARRSREVAEQVAADPAASIWTLASQVRWSAGWDGLGEMRFNALQQTAVQRDFLLSNGHPVEADEFENLEPVRYLAVT